MAEEYRRHLIPAERLYVTPLPPAGIQPYKELPVVSDRTDRVLMIGRLTNLKGATWLVSALPETGRQLGLDLSLTIVGDGPERLQLQRLALHLRQEVEFRPWLDFPQRNELFRSVDLLVMPSVWPEPWGLAGIEAACVGVPSVAFAAGGIPEWLVPGETGELAPADPPTVSGLAAAIGRALEDREHYWRLRRGAWNRAKQYTMAGHLEQLLPVLERAVTA
jgi:glycosyltransferase involved in cell wall biosynthesis